MTEDVMNTQDHGKAKGGFTLAEVIMAVGVVVFGLVAVFSILPFGLTAQKNNQEETVLRYEAEYWFAALQSGGLPLESLNRAETIELWEEANSTTPYSINRFDLSVDQSASWPADVCGWLSAPNARVDRKYAYVRAINGSLFDRLNGPRHRPNPAAPPEYYLPGGEFAFGYILETQVEPAGSMASKITLTFRWPISENAGNALRDGVSIHQIIGDEETKPAKKKAFTILTSLRPRPALMERNLELEPRQISFMRTGLPGDEVTFADLVAMFPDRNSWEPWDGNSTTPNTPPWVLPMNRRLKTTTLAINRVAIEAYSLGADHWKRTDEWDSAWGDIQRVLSPDDPGWFFQIDANDFEIILVHSEDDYATLDGPIPPALEESGFTISFLRSDETWPDLLDQYQQLGLGKVFIDPDTGEDKWRFGSIHNSYALGALTNPAGAIFRIPLENDDYFPDKAPNNKDCSFWFLR